METYLVFGFFIFFVCLIIYSLYEDTKNNTWNALVAKYGNIPEWAHSISYSDKMVFFKREHEKNFDYFNSMKVARLENGIEFQPTIVHFVLKPLFLPYDEMEEIGKKNLFIWRRTVYKVKGTDILIGV